MTIKIFGHAFNIRFSIKNNIQTAKELIQEFNRKFQERLYKR